MGHVDKSSGRQLLTHCRALKFPHFKLSLIYIEAID